MTDEKKQQIALMRYATITPLVTGQADDHPTNQAFFDAASLKGSLMPDGRVQHFAPATIERWYLNYQKGGFDALLPAGRSDAGKSRSMDSDVREQIRYLKTTYPRMSSAAIFRQLKDNGTVKSGELSESTINRFVKQLQLEMKLSNNKDMRRYERPHINEVWCGDSSVGPRLTDADGCRRRVYVIALIDDASRFIVAADVFFNDNFINLMSVLRSAVSRAGRPKTLNFDNGKSYRNKQMELLAARIGTALNYCQPYTPTSKSKIERWFRTMKDQWMAALNVKDFHTLDELRGSLLSYIQKYNQTPHSSLHGKTPQERFFSEPECIKRLSPEEIEKDFLLEIERRVSADSVIVIDQVEYEVDYRFAKQRVRLRYSPDMQDIFLVEPDGTLTPIRLLNKHENAVIKRDKVRLAGGEE